MITISKSTIRGIDFLRGIFSILVLASHAWGTAEDMKGLEAEDRGLLGFLIVPGTFWVIGFFVLSGFCIGLSVFRSIGRGDYSNRRYLLARLTRIYPLFLLGLALAVVVWFLVHRGESFPASDLGWNLLILTYFTGAFPNYAPAWSITCEVVYYLLFPIVIVLAGRSLRRSVIVGFLLCVVLVGATAAPWFLFLGQSEGLMPVVATAMMAAYWYIGLAALLAFREGAPGWLRRWALPIALVTLVVAYASRTLIYVEGGREALHLANGLLISVGFALLVVSFEHRPWLGSESLAATARWMGLLSYPLYLFHAPIQAVLENWLSPELPFSVLLLLAIAIPLLISGTAGVAAERAILSRRRTWLRTTPLTPPKPCH